MAAIKKPAKKLWLLIVSLIGVQFFYLEALKIDSDNIFALNGLKQVELELKK